MMPSLDSCVNPPSEMTTLTNTLEVFDTYKHREDKDSDEESFHLPLDDDETESKPQDLVRNGNGNESEDEILNKFDGTSAALDHIDSQLEEQVALDHIDSQLEERLLNDDEEEKKGTKSENCTSGDSVKSNLAEVIENGDQSDKESKDDESCKTFEKDNENLDTKDEIKCANGISFESDSSDALKSSGEVAIIEKTGVLDNDVELKDTVEKEDDAAENVDEKAKNEIIQSSDVPKIVIEEKSSAVKETSAIDPLCDNKSGELEDTSKVDTPLDELLVESNSTVTPIESNIDEEQKGDQISSNKTESDDNLPQTHEDASNDKSIEKCENSNDSTKHHNEDSEDLFDISIIRDAAEDNAESAYNEAHPEDTQIEENEEYDDRMDDKMEEDCVNEKGTVEEEEDDEMDIDKHEDHLKSDDVDIEEAKLECDATKDSISDGESETNKKTDLVKINAEQKASETVNGVDQSAKECRLDEVTGNLVGVDGSDINHEENLDDSKTNDEDSSKRKSLKRTLSEETESGAAKKARTDQGVDVEIKEVEKPKEKLPLKTLLSLSDFMKSKKHNKRLTMHDLEEFCVQKICEVIVHKSELGDVHHQLKLQEQLIETMRKEIQQLTKQARDLEIVNKKLLNDLKQQTISQKPLNPLKITRSVGLQVKFTPAFEANLKRRQPNATVTTQKVQAQAAPRPRAVTNAVTPTVNRQIVSPQKQQQAQQLPKPNTPLLSQALQNRRPNVTDTTNKIPNQVMRSKSVDAKSGAPSASVIDLTDEDDKKDKNKSTPNKMVPPKSITVPLRTPMRVNTTQGIRLTTSQGKVSPITSVVTTSAPQVMYVVQSSSQNVLTSALGSKAVVVNFQSANGVLTSALNGSAVSVIPKQQNTIQLKTVTSPKVLQNNKIIKIANKHPAPLPPPPVVRVNSDKSLKPIPPKPHLTIRKTETGIILQWKMPYELDMFEVIASYQLYAYQETSALPSTDMWRKVGDVKALALPMACTLTQFADKNKYYFAVRPVDIHKRIGNFSEPEEISL